MVTTALTNHCVGTKHTFNFENAKILKTDTHNKKRQIYEIIEIQKNPKPFNWKNKQTL